MKRLLTLVIVLVVTVLPAGSATSETLTGATLFQQAAEHLAQGNPLEAAALYRRILEGSVDREERARALLFSATLYSRNLQLPDTAASCLSQIVTTYEDTMVAEDAAFALGVLAYRRGQYADAMNRFETFMSTYPQSMRASSAREWVREASINLGKNPTLPQPSMETLPEAVRILVEKRSEKILAGSEKGRIAIRRNESDLYNDRAPVTLTARKGVLLINGVSAGRLPVTVDVPKETIRINERVYRGKIEVTAYGDTLDVVNTLPVESYLKGVLPREMGYLWPPEALKAQAVASRTYTFHCLLSAKPGARFDLEATTAFQVYHGAGVETPETNAAVEKTKGLYLAFQGRPIIACFHANSGGFTEDADAVWGTPLPYLRSTKDSFSRIAPETCWEATFSSDEVVKRLWENGYSSAGVLSMEPLELTPAGRITTLRLGTTRGRLDIPGNAFRLAMDPTKLKSTRFSVTKKGKKWVFSGCGYGHGVGMSQWGARKMADSGFTFDTILYHYYKSVSLVRIDKERPR